MATIRSSDSVIAGTAEDDIIEILNSVLRVTVYGGAGNDGIEQPSANPNLNMFFDGGAGYDTLNLKWVSGIMQLSFTVEWKLIGSNYGIELKVSGNNGAGYTYNATVINGEGFWVTGVTDTDYSLLTYYLPLYGIIGPTTISPVPPGYYTSAGDPISVQSLYWSGDRTFGAGRDVITFFTYGTIANLGDGDDMACIDNSSFGIVDGGEGNDTYVIGRYSDLAVLNTFNARYTLDVNGWLNVTFPDLHSNTLYLKNFEQIIYADRIIGVVTAKPDDQGNFKNEALSGQATRSSVVAGGTGNDTLTGVYGGDTLLGGKGDDLLVAAFDPLKGPLATNIVRNGSFESNAIKPGKWGYLKQIDSWNSYRFDGKKWVIGGQMEVWRNFFLQKAADGDSLVELDADRFYNGIGQTLNGLKIGAYYQISFSLTARNTPNDEHVDVYWGNTKLGVFKPDAVRQWTTITLNVQATAAATTLKFLELAGETNGLGVLLDNVKVQQINPSPIPNTLNGGAGRDTLVGSAGKDVFVFDQGETGATLDTADVIRKFTSGQDVVDVSALAPGQSFVFRAQGFSSADGLPQYTLQKSGNGFLALFDQDGDNNADAAIFFENIAKLAATDFKFL